MWAPTLDECHHAWQQCNPRRPNGSRAGVQNRRARQRALAISVAPDTAAEDPLAELKELLRTAGVATAGEMVQHRDKPDPDRYFGRGKLAELKAEIKRDDANLVATDDELLPRQERNLERRSTYRSSTAPP